MIRKIIKKVLGKEEKTAPAAAAQKEQRPAPASQASPAPEKEKGGKAAGGRKRGPESKTPSSPPKEEGRPASPGRRGGGRGGKRTSETAGRGRSSSRPQAHRRKREEPFPDLPPLPSWSPPDDPGRFASYDLPEQVREGISAAGFTECTEVQSKVLPIALQGRDIAAQSQTGTGKTAAFLVTIFTRLLHRGPVDHPGPRALILAPTRELTVQIERDAKLLGGSTGLTVGVAFGGVDYDKQRQALIKGVDILVGTPGRLIDYLKQDVWSPRGIDVLVIDEADRMLDMGFIRDLRFILKRLPPFERRLSMLFSATLSWRAMELTYEYMNLPEQVSASPEKMTAERAEEVLYHVARNEKAALLLGLLKKEPWERAIIFSNMKIEAEKVGRLLQQHGIKGQAITGNLDQRRRLKIMEEFKKGALPILVATDVASRGLHIDAVSHVFNWDLPQDPEDYVHRIGRTARAGATGKAISLADEESVYYLESIEELIGYKVPVDWHTEDDLAKVERGWERRPPGEREKWGAGSGRGRGQGQGRDRGGRSGSGGGKRPGGRGGSGGRGRGDNRGGGRGRRS